MADFTVIDDGVAKLVDAVIENGRVFFAPASVAATLGWELKPQGLCRADTCIAVRDRDRLVVNGRIDLASLAELLERPLALAVEASTAALGESARERGRQLASLEAPDFTLPDLDGKLHSLSDYRGRKVLLVAYASW